MLVLSSLLFLFIALFLESTLIHVPLVLLVVIFVALFAKKEWSIFFAVGAGLLLDSLTFRLLGSTSVFFLVTVGILLLYGRKFETNNILFGILFTCLASIFYLFLFGNQQFFLALLIVTASSGVVFVIAALLQHAALQRHLV